MEFKMVLPEFTKSRVRVHLGVPVIGLQDSGNMFGYRFAWVMGLLEYRLNNLQPFEFAGITGTPTASISLMQNGPVVAGNTLTIAINNTPVTYTITPEDAAAQNPVFSIASNASVLLSSTLPALVTASAQPAIVFPVTTYGENPQQWQMAITSTNNSSFTVAVSGSSSNPYTYIALQGLIPHPNYTFIEDQYTANGYVPICDYLEQKTAGSSDLMKFSKADVVNFRPDELGARSAVYQWWRRKLAEVFGIPLYPLPAVSRYGGASTTLVM
jgi:hypothetical protein